MSMQRDLILAKLQENNALTIRELAQIFNVNYHKMRSYLIDNDIKIMSMSERMAIRNKKLCTQPPLHISDETKQIILGSLLGDGTIVRKRTNCIFVIRHSLVQKDYVLYKYKLLSKEFPDVKYEEHEHSYGNSVINGRIIKDNGFCVVRTPVNQSFNSYRDEWYIPKKEVPDSIYELGPLGLAIWYIDDGAIHYPTGAYFSTQGFSHSSLLKLQNMMLKNFGLHVNIHKNKHQEVLYLSQKDYSKFVDIIKEYVCPSMNYKIIGHNKQGELLES